MSTYNKINAKDNKESNNGELKPNNNIRDIRNVQQLDTVSLDFDSPRLRKAMDDYGISLDECYIRDREEFE